MKTLKKLHARFRTWVKGEPHRPVKRQVRLELETLERRDVPTAGLYPEVSASYGATNYLFGLTANGQVEVSSNSGGSWTAVTGSNTVATSLVAADGGLYMLATNGATNQTVWQYSGSGNNWTPVTGSATNTTALVGADGGLFMLGSNGAANQTVWEYSGSGSNWRAVTGTATNATALVGNGGLYMLGSNGAANQTVWEYNGWGCSWTPVTGTSTNATALVGASGGVFMLGSNGAANQTVWQYSGSGSNWTPLTGSNTQVLQLIAGSGSLFMVGDNGGTPVVWQYNGSGSSWTAQTGTALQNALASWDLARAHPVAATAYSPVNGTLFGTYGPSYLDVQQGVSGDCWLMASLAETAARVCDISNMFVYEGSTTENGSQVGVYSVRYYTSSGVAQYVTVDTELPSGGTYYDRPENGVLWAALAEKAYVEAIGAGYVSSKNSYHNAYAALDTTLANGQPTGGDYAWALQAITGKSASDYNMNPSDVANAWNAGQLIVLGTTNPTSSYIAANHDYAVVGYNASASLPFEIYNPWGTDGLGWAPGHSNTIYGLFIANGAFLSQNFVGESFGAGAAPGDPQGPNNTAGVTGAVFANLGAGVVIFHSSGFGLLDASVVTVTGEALSANQAQGGGIANALSANTTMTGSVPIQTEADGNHGGGSPAVGTSNDAASILAPVTRNRTESNPGIGGGIDNLGMFADALTLSLGKPTSTSGDDLGS